MAQNQLHHCIKLVSLTLIDSCSAILVFQDRPICHSNFSSAYFSLLAIGTQFRSFYHWSLQFASSNQKAVSHFPAQNINCYKLRIYQSVVKRCSASLIFYYFALSNRLAFALGLATVIQADRSILEDELRFRPIRQSHDNYFLVLEMQNDYFCIVVL